MLVSLTPHPDTPSTAVTRIEVDLERVNEGGVVLAFRAFGDPSRLRIPTPQEHRRADELWRHTCFEAFVRGDGPSYRELNLSPSSQWAAYQFDDYRVGMTDAPVAPWAMECTVHPDGLEVKAEVDLGRAGGKLALSAVIEDFDGAISYWALAHPSAKPDFHHPDSFVLDLP